jgi:hypothetical protein
MQSNYASWAVFVREDEGSRFHRNVGKFLPDYTASHPGSHRCENLKPYISLCVCVHMILLQNSWSQVTI